jgi:ribosomal protein L36
MVAEFVKTQAFVYQLVRRSGRIYVSNFQKKSRGRRDLGNCQSGEVQASDFDKVSAIGR